ncbi:MAG: hypothetical protein JXR70_13045 [Spirochaetales bacterium]|nr:hypothetical protein [Spirochaetales bacterium]
MKFKTVFFYMLILVLATTCGVEVDYPILEPPAFVSFTAPTFKFMKRIENSETTFRGFELYYKFYSTTLDGQAQYFNESNLKTFEDMNRYRFRRMTRYNSENDADTRSDSNYPLIKIPPENRSDYSVIEIDFSNLSLPYVRGVSIVDGGLGVRRGVFEANDSEYYKAFNDTDPNDDDLEDLDTVTEFVLLSVYVFSYGKKDLSIPLYSEAVHLTNISIQQF